MLLKHIILNLCISRLAFCQSQIHLVQLYFNLNSIVRFLLGQKHHHLNNITSFPQMVIKYKCALCCSYHRIVCFEYCTFSTSANPLLKIYLFNVSKYVSLLIGKFLVTGETVIPFKEL